MRFQLYIGILLLAMVSCTRNEVLPGTSSGPVYKAAGSINGEPFEFSAGADGMELIPTYSQTDYGVFNLVGRFQQSAGSECLSIKLNNHEQSWPGDGLDPSAVIYESTKSFQKEMQLQYNVIELASFGSPESEFTWELNENLLPQTGPVIDEYVVTPGNGLTIDLTVDNGEGCTDHIQVVVDSEFSANEPVEYRFFTWEYSVGSILRCEYTGDYSEIETIQWTVNGPNAQQIISSDLIFQGELDESGIYELSMLVELADGTELKHSENIPSYDLTNPCAANVMFRTKVPSWNGNGLDDVVVEYINGAGDLYSSVPANNELQSFEILEVLGDIVNQQGKTSKVIRVSFSCELVSTINPQETMLIENVEALLAVSYPQ